MPEDKLKFLGDRIRSARKDCGLTQQALADQADLAVKTIQDVERGRKNTTYETLCQLIERLGISPNSLFPSQMSPEDEAIQRFIGKFRACDPANQEILLSTLDFLAEKLLARQHTSESDSSLNIVSPIQKTLSETSRTRVSCFCWFLFYLSKMDGNSFDIQ